MARELSSKNTRRRLQRRLNMDIIRRDVEMIKPVSEWDWEELQRGYPRAESGKFGPRPNWADLFRADEEVQRRLRTMSASHLRSHVGAAVGVLVELMSEDGLDLDGKPVVPPSVRLKAAELVLDHTIGKPTAHVEVDTSDKLGELLANCLVNDDGEDAHPAVIPGAVIDEEDEDL